MVAINCIANGNVASDLSVASANPTNAEVVMIRELQIIIMAVLVASRGMFLEKELIDNINSNIVSGTPAR